ncbi:MAG: RNA polymerase sigma factor [Calditrichota bacterium]
MNSDWHDLDRARHGDKAAWQALLDRHYSRLLSMTLLITGNPAAAQDIAQEAVVKLFRAEIRHRTGTVGGLLTTIAYRLAVKEKNRTNRHTDLEHAQPAASSPSPLDALISAERQRHVAEAIQQLDDEHRAALALRFYGGHSYQEIADLTGVPLGTVKSRIFYAVKNCQAELRKRGVLE